MQSALHIDEKDNLVTCLRDIKKGEAINIEGKEYIALLPQEDETVLLYEYKELDNDEIELNSIEDDDEFDKVTAAFDEIFNDEDED